MKKLLLLFFLGLALSCSSTKPAGKVNPLPLKILVFYKTSGYYHTSIPAGLAAIQKLGVENAFSVDTTKNAAYFQADSLRNYQAVVFLSTTEDVLNLEQQAAFEKYIRAGNGFMGIHAATDTEYDWPWYNQLVGAYFESHPQIQTATVQVTDKTHPATHFLPDQWVRRDEWYNFKNLAPGLKVLANLDETSYKGGKNGANHPIAWYHPFDGGRSFYTGGGHTNESFQEPLFLRHILQGILYAMGR